MVIGRPTNDQPSVDHGGAGSKSSTLDFKSCVLVDMNKFSQSELYALSRSSTAAIDDLCNPGNDVITNVKSDNQPTGTIVSTTTTATTGPRRIFAFSQRRGRRYCISRDGDKRVAENRLILKSLEGLVSEGLMNDSNSGRVKGVPLPVDSHCDVQKRKRKRKSTNEEEFEGFGVMNVNGEAIDLKFLARSADNAFESELNRMTEGMVSEEEFLGFIRGLEGRWGSTRKRRKYVDATVFVKALPINWNILLSLRPRVRRPSLYCRRFVSPTGVHFNSCKEVAFFLKSQGETSNANPKKERALMQIGSNCIVDLDSDSANDPENILMNGVGSSNSEEKRNLKTSCIWCQVEFIREPVDAETLASSSGFICPKCKEIVSWSFESALPKLTQHAAGN